jgi:periplasmic copper chaperone A
MRTPTTIARVASGVLVVALTALHAGPAAAHTEADLVAVPAGSEASVTFRPTHGCGDSPTVEVRVRVPVADAVARPVEGWTETAEPGEDGTPSTVLTWSGGSLPADRAGAFPLEFAVPDQPGLLLTFPAIQRCADGQELAWISGDPTSPTPAPRLLVLPAGSPPAASIDEVAPDAPGRDQLVAIVDVDGPGATTVPSDPGATEASTAEPGTVEPGTTTPDTATPGTEAPDAVETAGPGTTAPSTAEDPAAAGDTTPSGGGGVDVPTDDGGGSSLVVVLVVAGLLAVGAVVAVLVRRRSGAR